MKLHAYLKKSGLLLLTAIVGSATGSITVQAAQDAIIEEVVDTGSRIPRDANLTGALPVQSVDADDIQLSGEYSISDLINDIPALLMSVTSEQSIDAEIEFDDGANVLNLRAWQTDRLVRRQWHLDRFR